MNGPLLRACAPAVAILRLLGVASLPPVSRSTPSLPVFFREPCRALSGEVPNHQCPPPSAELERGPANRRESRYSSQCSLVFKCVARLTKPTPNGTINFLFFLLTVINI